MTLGAVVDAGDAAMLAVVVVMMIAVVISYLFVSSLAFLLSYSIVMCVSIPTFDIAWDPKDAMVIVMTTRMMTVIIWHHYQVRHRWGSRDATTIVAIAMMVVSIMLSCR